MTDDATDPGLLRRRVLQATTAGIATGAAGCLGVLDEDPEDAPGSTPPDDPGPGGTPAETPTPLPEAVPDHLLGEGPAVGLETVAEGLKIPTDAVVPGGDDRLFVADQFGTVHALDPDGETPVDLAERDPFLDLGDRILTPDPVEKKSGEAGLLGLAFHPAFPDDDRLFVRYSAPPGETTPDRYHHVEVLAAFRASGDRTRADPDSERILLEVPQFEHYHNSGSVAFGPDGYCYLTTGDSGAFAESPDGWDDGGTSQNTEDNLLGGVLRIDVDREDGDRPYGIPPDNPLADRAGHRGEYYAWGFRNPWGLSFDGEDCYVAVVGAQHAEWVARVEKGGNYGWPIREGSDCSEIASPEGPPDDCPDRTPEGIRGGELFREPVVEYPREHEDADGAVGMAVVGGGVYRGEDFPELRGEYVFADLRERLFAAAPPGDDEVRHPYYRDRDLWPIRELDVTNVGAEDESRFDLERPEVNVPVISVEPGGIYVLTSEIWAARDGESAGAIHRVVPPGGGD